MFERHTRPREPQTMNLFLTRPAWGGALLALAWCAASAATLPAQAQTAPLQASPMQAPLQSPVGSAPASPRSVDPATGEPMALNSLATVGTDYRMSSNDLLEFDVFGVPDMKRDVRVNASGLISLPLIGPLPVAGLSAQDAETLIA